jgi:hypothetical protein
MIPERGLPFAEEPGNDTETAPEIFEDSASLDDILTQASEEIAAEEGTSEVLANAATPSFAENDEPTAEEEVPSEFTEDGAGTPVEEAPSEILEDADPADLQEVPDHLLDIDEIRTREQELAEDFHGPAPDFEGDSETDFATARVAAPLPATDREAIMLESGAGIIREEDLSPDETVREPVESDDAVQAEIAVEEITTPMPDKVTTEVVEQTVSKTQPGSSTEKETRVIRQEAVFRDDSIDLPGPTSGSRPSQAPELVRDLKASKKLLDLLVPETLVKELWGRADNLQREVFNGIDDLNIAQDLLEQIRSAKNLILSDKANYEEAERSLNEVEYRIIYGKRFKQWSFLGYLLLIYEVAFGIAAGVAIYLLLRAGVEGLNLSVNGILSAGEVFNGVIAALFGCIGGVAGALFALWRYMTEQKFNPQFSIWYITQPIIGLTVGIVIDIILKIGLNVTAGTTSTEVGSPLVPSLLAYLVGFQQNVFLDLARQVFKQFKMGGDKKEEEGAG